MKKHKMLSNGNNGRIYMILAILLCLFFITFFLSISGKIFAFGEEKNMYINENKVFYENENPINLEEIINQNAMKNIKEEMISEEIELEYNTKYKQNSNLASGVVQVLQEGRPGKKAVITIKKYEDDVLISEQVVAENILKSSVDKTVEIGTGNFYNNYIINEGDTVYVTAKSASIRLYPDENAEKICTLPKNSSIKVLKIEEDWLFVSNINIKGYIFKDSVTTKDPNASNDLNNNESQQLYTKQQLLAKLNFNIDLRQKSGLTLEQFKKVLSNDLNDKNGIITKNAEYFYYVEKQYNVNGIFVASIAVHESAWGTSTIANNKKNLFGYGAVDSNPYGGAYSFTEYSEGIDLVSRVLVKYYLNPAGTKIYDNDVANGKFYSGSTISAVGSKYASDKNWANSVYKWMEYFYNKI